MPSYYISKTADADGCHTVHWSGCIHSPDAADRLFLGEYPNSRMAVQEARSLYSWPNGCPVCVPECHR